MNIKSLYYKVRTLFRCAVIMKVERKMEPQFREDKATQVAAYFLNRRGGKMDVLVLVKLMYLTERKAILKYRRPVFYDSYVSMEHGTVVSESYNLIKGEHEGEIWGKSISLLSRTKVQLIGNPGVDKLSRAEELLLTKIYDEFGSMEI